MRTFVRVCVALVVVLASAAPAAADQLSAGRRPATTGPLIFEGKSCSAGNLKTAGEVVAFARSCIFLYRFSVTAEADALRDYGVAWVQSAVDPRNGWCATRVGTRVSLPSAVDGHAAAPSAKATGRPKEVTTGLVVDAEGHALRDGSISQSYRLYPSGLERKLGGDRRSLKTTWSGRTSKTLAFAVGMEFSGTALDSLFGTFGSFGGGLARPLSFAKASGC